MNYNYENRDKLLGEIHQSSKNTENTLVEIKDWCKSHDEKDDKRFEDINKKLLYGALALIVVAFASGVLGQLINHVKIGV